MEDFLIPELPVYQPFCPLARNSASSRKTARCAPVALKLRLMHQYRALFPSIRFPAGHNTIYLDAQVDRNGGGTPVNSDLPVCKCADGGLRSGFWNEATKSALARKG